MLVRLALLLIAVWVALQLLKVVLGWAVHLLLIGAVVFLIIRLVQGVKKTPA